MIPERTLDRRAMLKGLGTALALPFLESAAPILGATEKVAGSLGAAQPPLRMAFLFVPNGVHLDRWTPQREGPGYDLPYVLEPLANVKDDLLVLSGLTNDKGRANGDGAGDHARSASVFLTGSQPVKTGGADIRVGISVDQVAAQQIGNRTRFPSLELAIDPGRNSGNCDSGYSCAYSNNISWASPTTPMAKEIDPRRVFDRLFSEGDKNAVGEQLARRRRHRKSILDFVLEDSKRLSRQLGRKDERKLDEYFHSVREIEKRLVKAGRIPGLDEVEAPDGLPRAPGRPLEFDRHVRLMGDLMALAFQTDMTRVATFMLARAGSNRNYREIEVPDGHHNLSHHQGNPEKLDKIARINRHHAAQFAYMIERLKSIPEGDGTLLDNCMILYGSGLSDGNRHNNENLPILLAGRGGGTIHSGRHVRYREETPLCNLFLSMLDRMEVDVDAIGDSTGRLDGLVL